MGKSLFDIEKYRISISTSSASREAKNILYDICDTRVKQIHACNTNTARVENGDLDDIA